MVVEAIHDVRDFYKSAIPAESVARAIAFAIDQPADADINEIVLRPTVQEFWSVMNAGTFRPKQEVEKLYQLCLPAGA